MKLTHPTHVLAIFGIDGSGKSTVSKRISVRNEAQLIVCPRYHEQVNGPFSALSEVLNFLNQLGDDLDCFDLKAIAVYFQLTLYHPVMSGLDFSKPIISERHPLLDSLIYGPLFAKRIERNLSSDFINERVRPELEKRFPKGFRLLEDWIKMENLRMSRNIDFAEFPLYLKSLYDVNIEQLLKDLRTHFQMGLPDQAVYLDIDIELALEYIKTRSAYRESHENEAGLTKLREGYVNVFAFLSKAHPEMKTTILKPKRDQAIDTLAGEVLGLLPTRFRR
jgi:thymidylate kinase